MSDDGNLPYKKSYYSLVSLLFNGISRFFALLSYDCFDCGDNVLIGILYFDVINLEDLSSNNCVQLLDLFKENLSLKLSVFITKSGLLYIG